MRKISIALTAQTILTLDAGSHDGVQDDNGDVYVKLQSISGGEEVGAAAPKAAAPAKAAAKPAAAKPAAAEVADDTKPAAKPAAPATPSRSRAKAAPEPVEEEVDRVEIPEEEWNTLNPDDAAVAKLNMDGEDGEKYWDVTIIGWKKPKGSKEDKLYVRFEEDGAEDYLREGDRLFEFDAPL